MDARLSTKFWTAVLSPTANLTREENCETSDDQKLPSANKTTTVNIVTGPNRFTELQLFTRSRAEQPCCWGTENATVCPADASVGKYVGIF